MLRFRMILHEAVCHIANSVYSPPVQCRGQNNCMQYKYSQKIAKNPILHTETRFFQPERARHFGKIDRKPAL